MKLIDITVMSVEGLRERKGRVALNVLGILIGCAAVTGLISLANGMNLQVQDQLSVKVQTPFSWSLMKRRKLPWP